MLKNSKVFLLLISVVLVESGEVKGVRKNKHRINSNCRINKTSPICRGKDIAKVLGRNFLEGSWMGAGIITAACTEIPSAKVESVMSKFTANQAVVSEAGLVTKVVLLPLAVIAAFPAALMYQAVKRMSSGTPREEQNVYVLYPKCVNAAGALGAVTGCMISIYCTYATLQTGVQWMFSE